MSSHDMDLLMEGDTLNVDSAIQEMQGMQGLQGIQGMDGMGGMGGMEELEGMGGMEGMEGLGGMGGMGSIDGAMTLDDVDLFGDPVMDNALAVLPAPPPPSKPLLQRLGELRERGCCQSIAWSRQGTIAVISKDGMSIDFRFIRCRPDDGEWVLSEPSPWSTVSQSPSPPAQSHHFTPLSLASAGAPFVHIAWGPQGSTELAAIDALGRITILSFSTVLNRPYPVVRRWDADVADDLHAIVGCYWLPLVLQPGKQYSLIYGPATRTEADEYKYEHHAYPASGPWHPNPSKSSLVCVTANGTIKLLFVQSNNRPEETAIELESVTSSDDVITHASLCSDKNTLLLALATDSKQLRVVRVGLQWGLPQVDKQVPPGSVPLRPALKEVHVAGTSWVHHDPSEPAPDAPMAQLSHIELLPSAPAGPSPPMAPPVVLTVRSYVPQDGSPYHQESQSIIDRWEVVSDQTQSLQSAFAQLGSRDAAGPAPSATTRLRKLEPVIVPKIVVTVQTMHFSRVVCFAFSDGSVQYRDRFTMNEIYHEQNTDVIASPLHVGFRFVNDSPCVQVAFSPTNCSFVQLCEDWTVKWNKLLFPTIDPSAPLQPAQRQQILVGLSLAASITGTLQVNCDDVLAVARPFAQTPDFAYSWVRELMGLLKIGVDYSEDTHHDQLMRNGFLQLCFSMLSHLGFHGEFKSRPFGAKLAMLTLNVRNMVVLITVAGNTPAGIKEKLNPLDDPEVVDALAGCAKWGVDLLAWLTDSLFGLLNDPEVAAMLADPKRFPDLARYLQAKMDVSLHMVLCSSTRGFLVAACRRLKLVETISARAAHFYESNPQLQDPSTAAAATSRPHPALYQAYLKVKRVISSSVVKVHDFDRLLSGLSKDILAVNQKSAAEFAAAAAASKPQHQQANLTEQQKLSELTEAAKNARNQAELDMLLGGTLPPALRGVLVRFFSASLPEFRRLTDPARLYFADYDALEVDDGPRALALRRAAGRYVDVFRRVELVVGGPPRAGGLQAAKGGQQQQNALPPVKRNANGGGVVSHGGSGGEGGDGDGEKGDSPLWRRCVRCAAVMQDLWSNRPGYNFVLAQQRKCACGGGWAVEPKGT